MSWSIHQKQIALLGPVLAISDNVKYYCDCPKQRYQLGGVAGAGSATACEVTLIAQGKTCNSFSCYETYLSEGLLEGRCYCVR